MRAGQQRGPAVRVEYYGSVRLRAGVATDEVRAASVAELLRELVRRRRGLSPDVLAEDGTPRAVLVVLNERHVVDDLSHPLMPGDRVLLANPDVGG